MGLLTLCYTNSTSDDERITKEQAYNMLRMAAERFQTTPQASLKSLTRMMLEPDLDQETPVPRCSGDTELKHGKRRGKTFNEAELDQTYVHWLLTHHVSEHDLVGFKQFLEGKYEVTPSGLKVKDDPVYPGVRVDKELEIKVLCRMIASRLL